MLRPALREFRKPASSLELDWDAYRHRRVDQDDSRVDTSGRNEDTLSLMGYEGSGRSTIGPSFNGDLRRHDGRYSIHSHSQKDYDQQMSGLARDYLASNPDPNLHAFLRLNFAQLMRRHRGVMGICIPRPKLIPLPPEHAELLVEQTNRPAARK